MARRAHPLCTTIAILSLFSCSGAAEPSASTGLDLSGFEPSFSEEFDSLDISEWGCLSRWIAHTPWAGDFGAARFLPPGGNFPFEVRDGILKIKARRQADGRWASGMLSSWDACNSGFAQKYGYFEIRARLPGEPGMWPSFWLIGVDKRQGTAEVDVFEYLTHEPLRLSLGMHKHPRSAGEAKQSFGTFHAISAGQLSKQFNTYGVEITPDAAIYYLNRQEIWRTPMIEEMRQPMYILVSLAADSRGLEENTSGSAVMDVDYVRAFQRKPIGF